MIDMGKNKRDLKRMTDLFHGIRARLRMFGEGIFWRNIVAFLGVLVLVVTDAIPVLNGLPDTVRAADAMPKTGTITFYKYELTKYNDKGDYNFYNGYEQGYVGRNAFIVYEYDGTCYFAKNDVVSDGRWPTCKIDIFGCDYSPGADEFYMRCRPKTYDIHKHGSGFSINLVNDDFGYKGKAIEGNTSGLYNFTYNGARPNSGDDYRSIWSAELFSDNTVRFTRGNAYMGGSANSIGAGSYSTMVTSSNLDFWIYDSNNKKNYTCINADFKLGDNQVYVADEDLFLAEDVKLTIPDGAVLCVKKGPFYVNGEIECYGTILVEDGGSILPYASESSGSRIVMKEGGAMIIRSGGRVYAGCPKDSLGTKKANGWLDMNAGSSIINFGLLVAGQCNFKYGQATIENHKGAAMFLGYAVDNRSKFLNGTVSGSSTASSLGLTKTGGTVHYGKDSNITVIKAWEGGTAGFANKASGGGQTIKLYSYDKDGKCTIYADHKP